MFGRATIRLGIGPHSSYIYVIFFVLQALRNVRNSVVRERTINKNNALDRNKYRTAFQTSSSQ